MILSIQVNRFRCRHPRCNGSPETYSLFTAQEHVAQHFSQDCTNKSLKKLHYAFECSICRIGFVTKFYAVDHFMTKHHGIRQSYDNYSLITREHTDRYLKFSNVYMAAYLEVVKENKTVDMGDAPMPLNANAQYSKRPQADSYNSTYGNVKYANDPSGSVPYGSAMYVSDPYGADPYGADPYGNPSHVNNLDNYRESRVARSPVRSPAYRSQPVNSFSMNRERQNNGLEQSSMSGGEYANAFSDNKKRPKSPDNWEKKKTRGRGGPAGSRGSRREPMSLIENNWGRERIEWSGDPRRGANKSFGKRPNSDNNSSFYADQSFNASYDTMPQGGFNSSTREDRSFSRSRSRSPPRKMNNTAPSSNYGNDNSRTSKNRCNRNPSPGRNDKRSFSRSVSRSPSRSPLAKAPSNPPNNFKPSYGQDGYRNASGGYKTSNKKGNEQNRFGNTIKRNDRAASFSRSPSRSPREKANAPVAGKFVPSPKRSRSRSFSLSPER